MPYELKTLYARMLKSRLFEEAVTKLWHEGRISGEMHTGTGEEAIVAGIVPQLGENDAMALDHRGTSALLMRGVEPLSLLREFLGRPDGLCGGRGGHMHLFSRDHLAASSGIVGAAGPGAAGFALAAQVLRPGSIAVGFFGEGAMNQGMLMEALNLASVWTLPVVFVCKDDGWSITTDSGEMTGGDLQSRAEALGVPAVEVDGREVLEVREGAGEAVERARNGGGPGFVRARCVHLDAHFLGFQLTRMAEEPLKKMPEESWPMTKSFFRPKGGSWRQRIAGLKTVMGSVLSTLRDPRREEENDPIQRARDALVSKDVDLDGLENRIEREIRQVFEKAESGAST